MQKAILSSLMAETRIRQCPMSFLRMMAITTTWQSSQVNGEGMGFLGAQRVPKNLIPSCTLPSRV